MATQRSTTKQKAARLTPRELAIRAAAIRETIEYLTAGEGKDLVQTNEQRACAAALGVPFLLVQRAAESTTADDYCGPTDAEIAAYQRFQATVGVCS